MKWRKLNRNLHRDLGYFFFGMTIIYSISGIVLNHQKPGGDASIVRRSEITESSPVLKDNFDKAYILKFMEQRDIPGSEYKNFYFPDQSTAMIYLKNGHIEYDLSSGRAEVVIIKKRPILTAFNFLHYNKPKKLWTWFSDIYAISLILLAITGLFILRGKNGIKGRGAILVSIGILIPVIFLIFYQWLG
ncbi:MAG: PepSY-associated TM helix domain-containing protein [Bacteroidota bacterium]